MRNYILSCQARRVLSRNLTFKYKTCAYQIRSEGLGYRLRHALVTVCRNFQGEITVLHDSREPGCEKYVDGPEPLPLDDEKSVYERVENVRFWRLFGWFVTLFTGYSSETPPACISGAYN